jgi:hypothetical protein
MERRLASSGDVSKHMALLLAQSGNDGQQPLGKLTACTTLGPEAPLTPEHNGTEGPFGGIIGQFHLLLAHKSPQGRLVLQ